MADRGKSIPAPRELSVNEVWQAWFDGAACPNPGRIGLGAVLLAPDGRRFEHARIAADSGCNNEAELLALCELLELAHSEGARHLAVCGDSDFVVAHLLGANTTQVVRFAAPLARARQLLSGFASVSLKWVPRHRNRDADRLSRGALGLSTP